MEEPKTENEEMAEAGEFKRRGSLWGELHQFSEIYH
jgi:hypothetical protein